MDTKQLISDVKARFNHNSAKAILMEKYKSKLLIAEQNGLWRADAQTISLLSSLDREEVVLVDTFDNPVKINRQQLLDKLKEVYYEQTTLWQEEWVELEAKR
jgi:hypothetical protein